MSTAPSVSTEIRRGLMDAKAYPHRVDTVQHIETHISEIFLAGEFAYKIKKPIQTPFLDYRLLADRHEFCVAEVALNQRYAPDLYLGVVPIKRDNDRVTLDGQGKILEFAVKMRRFPDGALLIEHLRKGEVSGHIVDKLAASVARFHRLAERANPSSEFGGAATVWKQAEENFQYFEEHSEHTNSSLVAKLRKWSEKTFEKLSDAFERRRSNGFIRA